MSEEGGNPYLPTVLCGARGGGKLFGSIQVVGEVPDLLNKCRHNSTFLHYSSDIF